jgi:2-keto-4-pentenoate hydratase/2-oxohepta-3-ene-1,7-dioic acid hydratase in catechol pathway
MRLVRVGAVGRERPALLDAADGLVDVSGEIEDFNPAFFAGDGIEVLRQLASAELGKMPRIDHQGLRIGSPIARPYKIVCIGLNYADHADESGMPVPKEPVVFFKATNTIVGPNDDVLIPRNSSKTDWEVELGVVIGRTCRYLADETEAAAAIAGYTLVADISEREFQLERGGQWVKGKSCETFNPTGPWLSTTDEVPNPASLRLWLDVDGTRMQSGNAETLIFSVPFLVHYLSQFMVLEPGDLVNTGTPPGVGLGMTPPTFLHAGNRLRLGITGLGSQDHLLRSA